MLPILLFSRATQCKLTGTVLICFPAVSLRSKRIRYVPGTRYLAFRHRKKKKRGHQINHYVYLPPRPFSFFLSSSFFLPSARPPPVPYRRPTFLFVASTRNENAHKCFDAVRCGACFEKKRYQDGSFDAIVDKGTLDALMSEDTAQVRESAGAMLGEVKRVLGPAGRSVSERFVFCEEWYPAPLLLLRLLLLLLLDLTLMILVLLILLLLVL